MKFSAYGLPIAQTSSFFLLVYPQLFSVWLSLKGRSTFLQINGLKKTYRFSMPLKTIFTITSVHKYYGVHGYVVVNGYVVPNKNKWINF